ncbi:heparinase II/III family protein [Lysobacter zhanggongensis]|uniref:Heparinase II/III family protein n=1 Tax=Lysobacter zhanggongensis TaxID=1774951 RepID=A0ABU7YNK4_9GAMM
MDRLLGDVAVSHHNHALDQIYALTLAKRYLPFLDIPEDVLAVRLEVERCHLLSREGVVTENSPGYQSWIPARIAECQRLLTGATDTALPAQSDEFTAWITRPDGTWPEFGDTAPGKPVEPLHAAPTGRRVFTHAGYAVQRDADSHFAIKCGFLSHAHRHADDGTFLLHAGGEDWFIEAGMFGYARGWEREHARSPQGHNISYRAGANVIRSTTSRRWQRRHTRWGMTETDAGVACRSFMFDDAVYERRVAFLPGRIVLYDAFDAPGTIRTRFHVPADRHVHVEPGTVTLTSAATGNRLVLRHDLPPPEVVAAHHTVAYLQYGPCQAVEFAWPATRTSASFALDLHIRRQ